MQEPVENVSEMAAEAPMPPAAKSLGQALAGGAVLAALTVAAYAYLTWFEASGEASARMWAPVAILYNLGGKWLVVGVGAALSVFTLVKELRDRSNAR